MSVAPQRTTPPRSAGFVQRVALASRVVLGLALLLLVLPTPASFAGPVILGGDDLPLHGCYSNGVNQYGWLYIQKAMTKLFQQGCITRPNDGSIAALGVSDPGATPVTGFCAGSSDNGGSAIHYAAGVALGKTITYWNGASGPGSVAQFFADLASNSVQPAVIWICSGYGDLPNELEPNELAVINANASALAAFVNSGGGLMSHTSPEDSTNPPATLNTWLPTLIPGLNEVINCNSFGATLTPAGVAAFPGLSNSDVDQSAGPCHTHFQGPIGSLSVLAQDGDTPPLMYVIGGDCSTQIVCDSCASPLDTCCAVAPTFSAVEHPALSPNLMVGTREAFGSWPYCVTVFDLGSPPPSPLEDRNWAAITRFNGPGNNWNVDSLGSVFGLTVDKFGNIFVTHTSCYNFDYVGQVFGAAPGAVYRLDANTGKITTFCVLPNIPDPGVNPGSNLPGLGNITYDCRHSQFFVTNLEDGRIYRIKSTGVNGPTGTVLQNFDPMTPDNGAPGWAPLGERLWGVQWHGNRVYYSVWAEDDGARSNLVSNEIRSVGMLGAAIDPSTDRHELWLPALPGENYSNPVSDISFNAAGDMLLGERGIQNKSYSVAHKARALEFVCNAGCWTPSPNIFSVGYPGDPLMCAGGVDYDRNAYVGGVLGRTWASADLMHTLSGYTDILSGYQALRPTGGSNLNSVLVDSDGNTSLTDKTFIGDVEVVGCPGPVGTICGHKFKDLNRNGVKDGGEPFLGGWTMQLSGGGGPFVTTTDANGFFCFLNVPPGTYTLSEQMQYGWIQSAPAGATFSVTVAAGQTISGLDFGNYPCASSCATAPAGMVAWWPFDEPVVSTVANDVTHLSPSRNVAQLFGAAAITAAGHTGRMLCVPNETDYAKVPIANQLSLDFGAGSFAIDGWVNLNTGPPGPRMLVERRVLLSSSPYRTRGYALYFNGLQTQLEIGIGISTQIVPGPSVTTSAWHHLAVSVDRSLGQGRWYLDGAPQPSFNFAPTAGSTTANSDVYMGLTSPAFGSTAPLNGCVDDLEIFGAPLSAAAVATIYSAGASGKCTDIVRLPAVTSICTGQTSVTVCFNICNSAATTMSYHWSLAGLGVGAGCTVAGPVTFTPAAGTLTLGPGACSAPIWVTIPRPAGLTAQNATSCYQLALLNDSTLACQVRQGAIRADNTCWCSTASTTNLVAIPARMPPGVIGIPVDWTVWNPCGGTAIPYRIVAVYEPTDQTDPLEVSLNGLPPGEPVIGTLSLGPGGDPAHVEVLVSLPNGYDPVAHYTLTLEADTDGDGQYEVIDGTRIVSTYDETGTVGTTPPAALDFTRLRAAPNPFTRGSSIGFALARRSEVRLEVFDASGRLVRRLKRGWLDAGTHQFEWDGRDASGGEAAVGIYFVRLRAESLQLETRVVRLR